MNSSIKTLASLLFLLLLLCCPALGQEQITDLPFEKVIPALDADGLEIPEQRIKLADHNGWLVVTLTAEPNKIEWKIVLTKLIPKTLPTVKVHEGLPLFSIQYGPWFIRESLGRLRVHREPKVFKSDEWQQIGEAPKGDKPCTAGRLFVVKRDDWYWVCTSPKYDMKSIDTLIRFQHHKLKKGHGSMMMADGQFAEVFCGEARCHDEGDLLVASRITGYGAKAMISQAEAKQSLTAGRPMPAITGDQVGDVKLPTRDQLRGKVVLVDFWATWCGPCVKKLPDVNSLQQKYGDQGLVVVGVHANQDSDDLLKFVKENAVDFPIVRDDGATEKSFAVSQFPTYFLIGRDGKIASAFLSQPPTDAQIEAELQKADEQNDAPERRSRAK